MITSAAETPSSSWMPTGMPRPLSVTGHEPSAFKGSGHVCRNSLRALRRSHCRPPHRPCDGRRHPRSVSPIYSPDARGWHRARAAPRSSARRKPARAASGSGSIRCRSGCVFHSVPDAGFRVRVRIRFRSVIRRRDRAPSCTDRKRAMPRSGANRPASVPVSQACAVEPGERLEQRRAARRVEMRRHLVEQQQRRARRGRAAAAAPAASTIAISSAFCSPVEAASAGDVLRGMGHGEVGAVRPDRGAARRRIARLGKRPEPREGGPRRPAPASRPSQISTAPTTPTRARGKAAGRMRRRHRRAARSRRAAPPRPRPPRRAISSSSAASQAGSARPSRSSRERSRMRLLIAADPRRVRRIDAEDEPVHKAAPASGPSTNSRSICGVSHSTPSRSASADWPRTGSPSMRIARRSPPFPSRPVPIRTAPCRDATVAATAHPAGAGSVPRSVTAVDVAEPCVAQTAAGRQERHRLEQICLAGAVRPTQHHRARVEIEPCRAVIAEIGQDKPGTIATRPPCLATAAVASVWGTSRSAASMLPIWCEMPEFPAFPRPFAGLGRVPPVTRASASPHRARWRHWLPGRRRKGWSGSRHPPSSAGRPGHRSGL